MKYILLSLFSLLFFTACKNNPDNTENAGELPMEYNSMAAGDNSRNSLDWEGTYSGVLPCSNCRGVETYITIKTDNTYEITRRYLESEVDSSEIDTIEEVKTEGTFIWNEQGSAITLKELQEEIPELKVGELFLIPLDPNGFEMKAVPGNNFKLLKQ